MIPDKARPMRRRVPAAFAGGSGTFAHYSTTGSAVIALPVLSMAFRQAAGRLILDGTNGVLVGTVTDDHVVS